jgi:hypothetical protein
MDEALNAAFFAFHTSWVIFNCVGWVWRRTRRWHLAAVALTAASWFGLGIRYGWGYCPCTDWHWQVRARLGYQDPSSYMQLLIAEVIGLDVPAAWVDAGTMSVLGLVAVISIVLNVRDLRPRISIAGKRRDGRAAY